MPTVPILPPFLKPPPGAVLNLSHPLAVGLRSCYLFNEGGGSYARDYVGRDKLSLAGGPPWSANGAPNGMMAGQLQMSSVNHIGTMNWKPPTQQWGAEMWIRQIAANANASGQNACSICSDTGGGIYGIGNGLFAYWDTNTAGGINPGSINIETGGSGVGASTKTLGVGVWTHAVYTQPISGVGTFYINGVSSGTATAQSGITYTKFGADSSGNVIPGHEFALLRFYQGRALSAGDVQQLYQKPFDMFLPTAPQQRWWFLYKAGGTFLAPRPLVVGQAVKRASIY